MYIIKPKNRTLLIGQIIAFRSIKVIYHMMRNARFGPLTLLMTLRVINVKSDDKFTRLFYVSILDANIRFLAEAVFIGTDISFKLSYKLLYLQ